VKVEYTVQEAPEAVAKSIASLAPLWRETEVPKSLRSDGVQGIDVRITNATFEFVTLFAHRDFAVPAFRFRGRIESDGSGARVIIRVRRQGMVEAAAIGAGIVAAIEVPRGGPFGIPAMVVGALLLLVYWKRNQHLTRQAHPLLELLFARLELALRPAAG